jgi:hypothetical protein
MKRELASQYRIALTMLKGVIGETEEDTWLYTDETKEAAWHIAYHAVYYTNIYCSPSEEEVRRWDRQSNDCHVLGPTPWPPHVRFVPSESYSRDDIIAFIDFVLMTIPEYLAHLEPDKPCWPHWYKQNQFEFHLNNLRHIQHHTAQLIERNGGSSVGWIGVE